VHFLHIGKTGGSAIGAVLSPIAGAYNIVLQSHGTRLCDIPPDHRFFFFIRHPIPRFTSGFYSRLRRGRPRYDYEWSAAEAEAFSHFQKANDLAESLSSSHPEVVERARAAMRNIYHVNSSYRNWFSGERELEERHRSIVLIGLQEHLHEDFERLKSILHLPRRLSLPQDDVLAHRTPAEFDRRLTPLAIANLSAWYAEDIQFYEHCLELCGDVVARRRLG